MNEQDQRVRDFYQNLSMPQDKMEKLLKAAEQRDNSSEQQHEKPAAMRSFLPKQQWFAWVGAGLACGLVLTLTLWVYIPGSERTQNTVREVALNHTTRLEPEFLGNSLASLDNSMHQLPFTLTLPVAIEGNYNLIGSRYCSLSGMLAAHVKLNHKKTDKPMSLFVTSDAAELKEIQTQQTTLNGVEVEFWREGGLFFALAERS